KVRDGVTKWILRQVLHRRVPSELVDRPKAGFGAPIERWLRGPLRDWAEGLLSARSLIDGGFRAPGVIRRHWREHLERRRNWEYRLWAVLMLQAWHQSEASAVGPKIG
ncbi:MAG: asparagine synthase, partial [Planctomycetes bacterium]|nr:asparagine synthase [Planctomycetota bacterium]